LNLASPLRYPGGKGAMAGVLAEIRRQNGVAGLAQAEPYAGGAGASLSLLYEERTPEVLINDADPAMHALWWALTSRNKEFRDMLSGTRASMAEWRRQRSAYRSPRTGRLKRAFATFYLNRCNRSGIIIDGGPIGGIAQTGEWKIGARYNKETLLQRCQKVGEYADRIKVSGVDGIEFIGQANTKEVFLFIDPPYYHKGPLLYLNSLDEDYHKALANKLQSLPEDATWALTYDDCPEIRKLYRGWATVRSFTLRYTAYERKKGREVMITPRWMSLPRSQKSLAIEW
jgi:DNA adenine methylase